MAVRLPDRNAAQAVVAPSLPLKVVDRSRHQFRPHVAFRTALRPLLPRGGAASSATSAAPSAASQLPGAPLECPACLTDLPEGPYLNASLYLDAKALCELDAACRLTRALDQSQLGPWRVLGVRAFHGVELEQDGVLNGCGERFENAEGQFAPLRGSKFSQIDWKGRYWRFKQELPTFRAPFTGQEINQVRNPDEVAYCRCMLRADVLEKGSGHGVYIEIEVVTNPDNLSLAVVDFEAGGHSSVTFSPDTGAVIRERKVRESPRKVEGAYIQPLAATLPGRRFEGHLAFLRRCAGEEQGQEPGPWESTGFVTDLSWSEGRCLTPCLAFRDEGAYRVRIVRVGTAPPLALDGVPTTYDEARWSGLDWEAGEPQDEQPLAEVN